MARARLAGPAIAGVLVVAAGCNGKPPAARSAEDAYAQLLEAVDSGDGARLFDALDTPTQWAIETVHKSQREMRQLVVESYPPAERDAALQRIPAACEEDLDRPRRYFRRLPDTAETVADIKRRLHLGTGTPTGSIRRPDGVAEVWREGGSLFHFDQDASGRWGDLELRATWERNKERALHELDTVRENAALYKRRAGGQAAGPPGGKGSG